MSSLTSAPLPASTGLTTFPTSSTLWSVDPPFGVPITSPTPSSSSTCVKLSKDALTTACADFAKQNVPSCTTTFVDSLGCNVKCSTDPSSLQRAYIPLDPCGTIVATFDKNLKSLETSVWSKGCTAACAGPNSSTGNGYISGVVSGSMLDRGAAYCSCGEVGEPGSARKANVTALAAIVGDKFTLATVDGELNYLKNLAKDQGASTNAPGKTSGGVVTKGYRFGSVRSIMAVWIAGCSVLMLM